MAARLPWTYPWQSQVATLTCDLHSSAPKLVTGLAGSMEEGEVNMVLSYVMEKTVPDSLTVFFFLL